MPRPPRFRLVPSLALSVSKEAAERVLEAALGLVSLEKDPGERERSYSMGSASLFVPAPEGEAAPRGFLPLFVTDDLEAARAHLEGHGLSTEPMPWAPDAPGLLVRGPEGIAFCVADEDRVLEGRAARLVEEED